VVDLIAQCWSHSAGDRPSSFRQVLGVLEAKAMKRAFECSGDEVEGEEAKGEEVEGEEVKGGGYRPNTRNQEALVLALQVDGGDDDSGDSTATGNSRSRLISYSKDNTSSATRSQPTTASTNSDSVRGAAPGTTSAASFTPYVASSEATVTTATENEGSIILGRARSRGGSGSTATSRHSQSSHTNINTDQSPLLGGVRGGDSKQQQQREKEEEEEKEQAVDTDEHTAPSSSAGLGEFQTLSLASITVEYEDEDDGNLR
jgi:hypothetical protein